jgi:putative spermidine/putrescine transport system permease protein
MLKRTAEPVLTPLDNIDPTAQPPLKPGKRSKVGASEDALQPQQRLTFATLLTPGLLLFVVFFVGSFIFVVGYSFQHFSPTQGTIEGFTLDNYKKVLTDEGIHDIFGRTIRLSLIVTVLGVVMGYPVALALARVEGFRRTLLFVLVISPLFISGVIRAFAWSQAMVRPGIINEVLIWLGFIKSTGRLNLLYTEVAISIGLLEVVLPFIILPLSSSIRKQDPALSSAAQSLGANPFVTFWRVTLPLSIPGLVAGTSLSFIICMGSYVTPDLLGGPRLPVAATEVYRQVNYLSDWSLGGALAFILLATTMTIVSVYNRLLSGKR